MTGGFDGAASFDAVASAERGDVLQPAKTDGDERAQPAPYQEYHLTPCTDDLAP